MNMKRMVLLCATLTAFAATSAQAQRKGESTTTAASSVKWSGLPMKCDGTANTVTVTIKSGLKEESVLSLKLSAKPLLRRSIPTLTFHSAKQTIQKQDVTALEVKSEVKVGTSRTLSGSAKELGQPAKTREFKSALDATTPSNKLNLAVTGAYTVSTESTGVGYGQIKGTSATVTYAAPATAVCQ